MQDRQIFIYKMAAIDAKYNTHISLMALLFQSCIWFVLAVAPCKLTFAQKEIPKGFSVSRNIIQDAHQKVSIPYPESWKVRNITRRSGSEVNISLEIPRETLISITIYYRKLATPILPVRSFESWLRAEVDLKVKQRVEREGIADYSVRSHSLIFKPLAQHSSIAFIGDYSRGDRKWSEYVARLASDKTTVLIILSGPSSDIEEYTNAIDAMTNSTKMP